MSGVVCDASPLIFLAKLDRLDLIKQVLKGEIFVLQCVIDELQSGKATQQESLRLSQFLKAVEIIDFEVADVIPSALSKSDQSTLQWAIENNADWLLADERLLRRVASEEGIKVIGFLGILLGAASSKFITAKEVNEAVDAAISKHGCRISVAVYQRVRKELEKIGKQK